MTRSAESTVSGEYEDFQRDFRKLSKADLEDDPSTRSCPDLGREGVITARSFAQPGGFRREFMYRDSVELEVALLAEEIKDNTLNLVSFFSAVGAHTYAPADGGGLFEDCTTLELVARAAAGQSERSGPPVQHARGTLSIARTCVSTFKAFIGIGILFIPQAMTNAGWLGAPLILMASAIASTIGILLLGECHKVMPFSYPDMARHACGQWGYTAVAFQLALSQSCFATSSIVFLVSIFDHVREGFGWSHANSAAVCFACGLLLTPLGLIRRIGRMKVVNLVADVLIFGTVLAVCISALVHMQEQGGVAEDVVMFNWHQSLTFVGTSVYAFEGVALVIPIREEMARPEYFEKVLIGMMAFFFCMLGGLGLVGYLAWGATIDTVVLNEVPLATGILLDISYFFAVLFGYPIIIYPTFSITEAAVFAKMPPSTKRKYLKNSWRAMTTMFLALVAYGTGKHLSLFISFVGTFCSVPLALIFPAVLHFMIVGSRKALCCIITLIGLSMIPFTLYINVQAWMAES